VKGKVAESAEGEGDPAGELKSKEARRFAHLGELLRLEGRPKAAAAEYEKAYEITGAEAVHLANKLARTHIGIGNLERAEKVLQTALGPSPALVTTHVNLGRLYLSSKRYDSAVSAYQRANEINPFDPEIHRALASVYQLQGKKAEAEAYGLTSTRIDLVRRKRATKLYADGAQGFLSIHTTPWASVRISGKDEGLTTPIFRRPLDPGEHEIVFRIGGREVETRNVTITTGKLETLELELKEAPLAKDVAE